MFYRERSFFILDFQILRASMKLVKKTANIFSQSLCSKKLPPVLLDGGQLWSARLQTKRNVVYTRSCLFIRQLVQNNLADTLTIRLDGCNRLRSSSISIALSPAGTGYGGVAAL